MNFKKFATGAAIAASVMGGSLAALPAEALVIGGTPNYSPFNALPSTLTVTGETPDGNLTGGFTNVSGIQVGSVVINAGSSAGFPFNASYNATSSFLTNFQYAGQNAVLNLLAGQQVIHTILPAGSSTFISTIDFAFVGEIRALIGGGLLGNATGGFSASGTGLRNGTFRPTSFSLGLDASPVPVPTPALLPALLGMGAAALRKRKSEAAKAEAEAVEVNA